eukprot:403365673
MKSRQSEEDKEELNLLSPKGPRQDQQPLKMPSPIPEITFDMPRGDESSLPLKALEIPSKYQSHGKSPQIEQLHRMKLPNVQYDKEGDSFSSEEEKLNVTDTFDQMQNSLMVRKKSYRFMSIIQNKSDARKSTLNSKRLSHNNLNTNNKLLTNEYQQQPVRFVETPLSNYNQQSHQSPGSEYLQQNQRKQQNTNQLLFPIYNNNEKKPTALTQNNPINKQSKNQLTKNTIQQNLKQPQTQVLLTIPKSKNQAQATNKKFMSSNFNSNGNEQNNYQLQNTEKRSTKISNEISKILQNNKNQRNSQNTSLNDEIQLIHANLRDIDQKQTARIGNDDNNNILDGLNNEISEIKRISHRDRLTSKSNIIFKSFDGNNFGNNDNRNQQKQEYYQKHQIGRQEEKRNLNNSELKDSNVEMLNELRRDIDNLIMSSIMIDSSNVQSKNKNLGRNQQAQKDVQKAIKQEDRFFGEQFSDMTMRENFTNAEDHHSMRSFMSIIKKGNGETTVNPSDFKLKQSDHSYYDELGRHIQKIIDNSKRGDVIELPAETISVHSLYICRPITLIGKPGTVIEINGGSIVIDFNSTTRKSQNVMSQSLNQIIQQQSKDNNVPLKRTEVVIFQEIHIVFNRNKAAEDDLQKEMHMKQSTGIIIKNNKNPSSGMEEDQQKDINQKTGQLDSSIDSQISGKKGILSCFVVENDSFLEITDCYVLSIKDPLQIQKEKDAFIKAQAAGISVNYEENIDVEDCCFAMNTLSIYPSQKQGITKGEIELQSDFIGVISLNSTTISDFYNGIIGGYNSIINLDKSSIINSRGTAIKMIHPRIFKISSSVIQKCEEDALDIKILQPSKEKYNQQQELEQKQMGQQRKILIQANRFVQVKNHSIYIQQISQDQYKEQKFFTAGMFNQNTFNQERQNILLLNVLIKIYNNKIYGSLKDQMVFKSLKIKNLEIAKNDILKNQGHGIHLMDVQCFQNDPKRVVIRNNQLTEIKTGNAIHIEASSCHIDHNLITKNTGDGIFITTHSNISQSLSNSHQTNLQIPNIQPFEFEGLVEVQESYLKFNEGNGILASQLSQNQNGMETGNDSSHQLSSNTDTYKNKQLGQMMNTKLPLDTKKLLKTHFKNANLIIHDTEIWGNKGDGLKIKLLKTHILNCKIRQNVSGAISMEATQLTEQLVQIYADSQRTNDIKGKIYGDIGLLYPKIMIQDDIYTLSEIIKKQACQVFLEGRDLHSNQINSSYNVTGNNSQQSIRGCFGFGGNNSTGQNSDRDSSDNRNVRSNKHQQHKTTKGEEYYKTSDSNVSKCMFCRPRQLSRASSQEGTAPVQEPKSQNQNTSKNRL